jgi:SAM-dependent methyltransferase
VSTSRPERVARLPEEREVAEAFGEDATRYDRSRPGYPPALVERIVAGSPGPDLLDVGCGTGIAGRLFRGAGCRVLGVDPDPRMAAVASAGGLAVEVARFEDWAPAGRTFDAVVAAQAWHWIDPVAGAAKAARLLRPRGLIAVYWNAADLPGALRPAFADVYLRVLPGTPVAEYYARPGPAADAYGSFLDAAAAGLADARAFGRAEAWRYDWEQGYTRDEWLDQLGTHGGVSRMPQERRNALFAGLASGIDAVGGRFTMSYATVALAAVKR